MGINQKVYTQLKKTFGPVWIDYQGNFWPVCLMSERRLDSCLCHVREQQNSNKSALSLVADAGNFLRGEMALETVDDYLVSDQIDEDTARYLAKKDKLEEWERVLTQELRKRFGRRESEQ